MKITRLRLFELAGEEPEFPDLMGLDYLIEWLFDAGLMQNGSMGIAGLPHAEIKAWSENIGLKLEPLEASFLHKMSAAYVSEVSKSDNKDVPDPPFKEGQP